MQQCKKCLLQLSAVPHNKEGVCIYCQNTKEKYMRWDFGRDVFFETIERYRGKGDKYDVMVPITGGKDSTFALYCMTKLIRDIKVLAFTWDHGFHRKQSWLNIENAVKASGVDHKIIRIGGNIESAKKFTHGCHINYGCPCAVCNFAQTLIYRGAIEHQIPLIVMGSIQGQNGVIWENPYIVGHSREFVAIQMANDEPWRFWAIAKSVGLNRPDRIAEEIFRPLDNALKDPEFIWPDDIILGGFFNWNKKDGMILNILKDEFNFEKPALPVTHTSCELAELRGRMEYEEYIKKNSTTPSPMVFEICMLIRSGAITRKQGIDELEGLGISNKLPLTAIDQYIKKIKITKKEFDKYWLHLNKSLPLKKMSSDTVLAVNNAVRVKPSMYSIPPFEFDEESILIIKSILGYEIEVSKDIMEIIRLLDGKTNLSDVFKILSKKGKIAKQDEKQIIKALTDLVRNHFLKIVSQ